jgi:acyl transferase domain-containing protein
MKVLPRLMADAAPDHAAGSTALRRQADASDRVTTLTMSPTTAWTTTTAWTLSAPDDEALRARARQLLDHLTEHAPDPADIGRELAQEQARAAFEYRAAIVGENREDMAAALAALGRGRPHPALERGRADDRAEDRADVVFVFPGESASWPGMGAGLLETSAVFARRMQECAEALAPWTDWDLLEAVRRTDADPLEPFEVAHPVQWAVAVSLAELWKSFGVMPAAVVGHSRGELAAAVVAGAVGLDEGAFQIARRARLLAGSDLFDRGAMAAVGLPEEQLAPYLEHEEGVWLAAVNGPVQVVLSGDPAAVDRVAGRLRADDVPVLPVDSLYASHSGHIEALAAELAGDARFEKSAVPWYSTVTGTPVAARDLDGAYWYRNLRNTVRFEPTVRALLADGFRTFVEVGGSPVLLGEIAQTAHVNRIPDVLCVGSLRRGEGGMARMLRSAGRLWAGGGSVDWPTVLD